MKPKIILITLYLFYCPNILALEFTDIHAEVESNEFQKTYTHENIWIDNYTWVKSVHLNFISNKKQLNFTNEFVVSPYWENFEKDPQLKDKMVMHFKTKFVSSCDKLIKNYVVKYSNINSVYSLFKFYTSDGYFISDFSLTCRP